MRRLSNRFATTLLALAIPALGAAGCDNSNTTDSTLASTTTPSTSVTETYAGTVTINGAVSFNFTAAGAGTVTGTIKSLAPTSTSTIGLALGTWNGSACQIVIANDNATTNATVVGATSSAGVLCVRVYDVGKLTTAQTVEINVTHF
jgi:hypothetical protein